MAEYLASIFGTEKDKVNCTFYFKIGACRHGETCTRIHNKPTFSQTIVLLSMYKSPAATAAVLDPAGLGGLFLSFYLGLFDLRIFCVNVNISQGRCNHFQNFHSSSIQFNSVLFKKVFDCVF